MGNRMAKAKKPSPAKRSRHQVILLIISLIITLLILEGAARLLHHFQRLKAEQTDYLVIFQQDDALEWSHVPNTEITITTEDGDVFIAINEYGLRDNPYPYEKPGNTFRILILGDSFTEALQVNLEDTFHALIEDRLNNELNDTFQYEVISAGIAAYGTTRSMVFYEQEGYKYQPDLVLLAFYMGNDVRDDHPALAQQEVFPGIFRQQFFQINPAGELESIMEQPELTPGASQAQAQAASLVGRIDAWSYTHSRFYAYTRPFLSEQIPFIRRLLYRIGFVQSRSPVVPQYTLGGSDLFDEAWALEGALIARLRDEVHEDEADFAVILIPDSIQVQPELLKADYQLFYPAMLDDIDLEQTDRKLMHSLDMNGIPYVRLYEVFVEQRIATGENLYGTSSKHWNKAGHQLAAEEIYNWLLDENLVPVP